MDGASALAAWLETLAKERRASDNTVEAYRSDLSLFLGFLTRHLGEEPDLAEEQRDRGLMLAHLGRCEEAVRALRDYLDRWPEVAPDALHLGVVGGYMELEL